MRLVSNCVLSLSLSFCFAVHLQGQTTKRCKAPVPDDNLSREEQDATTDGYLAACRSAQAEDAHPLHERAAPPHEDGAISPNDAVSGDVSASAPAEDDYFWMIRKKGCKTLLADAKEGVEEYDSRDARIAFLRTLVNGMQTRKQCH